MKKCSALLLLACAFALATAARVAAAPVTWDFIATSCSNEQGLPSGCDPKTQYPVELATLNLAGPDASGSAFLPLLSGNPVLTGDPFSFDLVAAQGFAAGGRSFFSSAQPFGMGWAYGFPDPGAPGIAEYRLSWSEAGGMLTSVNISISTEQDSLEKLGLTGGFMSSDFELAGCAFSTCQVSGYWMNASLLTAPEPGSLALLASAFGMWGLIRRRRVVLHAT